MWWWVFICRQSSGSRPKWCSRQDRKHFQKATVSNPIFQKKDTSPTSLVSTILPKKSSNNSHFPCFIISSFNFASVFRSRGVRRGGKGGGTGPGHCLVEAGIKRRDQSGGWDELHGKIDGTSGICGDP